MHFLIQQNFKIFGWTSFIGVLNIVCDIKNENGEANSVREAYHLVFHIWEICHEFTLKCNQIYSAVNGGIIQILENVNELVWKSHAFVTKFKEFPYYNIYHMSKKWIW